MRGWAPAKVGAGSAAVAAVVRAAMVRAAMVRAAMVRAASEVGAAHAVLPTVRLLARLAVESLAREVGVAKAREVGVAKDRGCRATAAHRIREFVLPCRQKGSCGPYSCSKRRRT